MKLSPTSVLNNRIPKLNVQWLCFAFLLITIPLTISSQHKQGSLVEYYDGSNFERFVTKRTEKVIKKYWNTTPPVVGVDPQQCSIRWTGKLKTPETGKYHFSAKVDDGIRLWINDELVIDDWYLNDMGRFNGSIRLKEGVYYDLKIEYFNALVEGEIEVMWQIPDENKSWWKKMFDTDYKTITAEYFYQPDPSQIKDVAAVVKDKFDALSKTKSIQPEKKTKVKKPKPKKAQAAPNVAPIKKETIAEAIKKYTPKNIEFDRAQSVILPSSFDDLDQLANFLNDKPSLTIVIEGHTDNVGNADKNLDLSQKRAYAIASYLVKKDVSAQRIKAKGYGGTRPLIKSEDGVYHPQNRRVEFIIQDDSVASTEGQ